MASMSDQWHEKWKPRMIACTAAFELVDEVDAEVTGAFEEVHEFAQADVDRRNKWFVSRSKDKAEWLKMKRLFSAEQSTLDVIPPRPKKAKVAPSPADPPPADPRIDARKALDAALARDAIALDGVQLKALSKKGKERVCTIVGANDDRIQLHYEGFDSKFDEWLPKSSERLLALVEEKPRSARGKAERAGAKPVVRKNLEGYASDDSSAEDAEALPLPEELLAAGSPLEPVSFLTDESRGGDSFAVAGEEIESRAAHEQAETERDENHLGLRIAESVSADLRAVRMRLAVLAQTASRLLQQDTAARAVADILGEPML